MRGFDRRSIYNYDKVVDEYLKLQCITDVSWALNMDQGTVKKILESKGVHISSANAVSRRKYGVPVHMHDKETKEIVKTFETRADAASYIISIGKTNCKHSTIRTHIKQVCDGRRKSAAGYFWSNAA